MLLLPAAKMPDPMSEAYDSFESFAEAESGLDAGSVESALLKFLQVFRVKNAEEVAKSLAKEPAVLKEEYGFVVDGKMGFNHFLQFLVQHSHLLPEVYRCPAPHIYCRRKPWVNRDVFEESVRELGVFGDGEQSVYIDDGAGCRALLHLAEGEHPLC